MQQNELTESAIYEAIAKFAKGEENKKTLNRLADEEKAHYEIWKNYTGVEMKPEKLKSGNWRCKVYLGTDPDGKKIFKSVTAPTKKEAIAKAAELALDDKKIKQSKLTVGYCIEAYIHEKESELSPHTV